MSTVNVTIDASVREVWDALVDVRTYPTWLIGATKIRSVDEGWPAPGTAFHHEVGLGGPLTIADRTRCDAVEPPHVHQRAELRLSCKGLVKIAATLRLFVPPQVDTALSQYRHLAVGVQVLDSHTEGRQRLKGASNGSDHLG